MSVARLLDETYTDTPNTNSGVCVADGYGLRITVQKRHLVIADGQGTHRRTRRYPRVGHGLGRLIILGHSGTISLEALRWLDRVGIATTHIDTDGNILTQSVPTTRDDARLRRAQALAPLTPVGLEITRTLLDAKLAGQASVASTHLNAPDATRHIENLRDRLADADTLAECRELEATAAKTYFAAWPGNVALTFARNDRNRIPDHWTTYTSRRSQQPAAYGSARNATDPLNAILNYLYTLAELECRHACHRLGLDPGLGFLHTDTPRRDSLALDLIEPLRPHIDAWTIDLAHGHHFRADDFHETDTGTCRVLPPLTHHLTNTLPTWRDHAEHWAEHVAHRLAHVTDGQLPTSTPLTNARRRSSADAASSPRRKPTAGSTRQGGSAPPRPCPDCGSPVPNDRRAYCDDCWNRHRQQAGRTGSDVARLHLDDPIERARRGAAISDGKRLAQDRRATQLGCSPSDWEHHAAAVQTMTLQQIMEATGYSISHASRIRTGKAQPHPRHWSTLIAAATSAKDATAD